MINATADSFFPGSRTPKTADAVERALRLIEEGADWIDIGGESTRPGSSAVSAAEELRRVIPIVEAVAEKGLVPISVDTQKPEVARAAREAGASILNDVGGLRAPGMLEEAIAFDRVIVMHMAGSSPADMQRFASYGDVVREVKEFLKQRRDAFVQAGGDAARLVYDPGIGFGKTVEQNLSLIKHVGAFKEIGPVLLGASRKSFIGRILNAEDPNDRLEGSLGAACYLALQGVDVLRVHDVSATRRCLELLSAINGSK